MRKWLQNMNIATRLSLGFGVLVFLIISFGLITLQQLVNLENQAGILYRHPFSVIRSVDALEIEVLKIHREMKDLAHTVLQDKIITHQSIISVHDANAQRHLNIVISRFLGDPQIAKNVDQLLIDWRPIRDEVIQLRLEGDLSGADTITRGKGARHVSLIESELEELNLFAVRKASDSVANAKAILNESIVVIEFTLVIAVLLSIAISILLTRSIRIPLTRLEQAAIRISEGDLGQQVAVNSQDELGRLASTFNSMSVSIRKQTEVIQLKNDENERLLLNILPGPIADRLKQGEKTIADSIPEVTVLFADIVGFTAMSENIPPKDLVSMLNNIFTTFDDLAGRLNIEKIKTSGDSYMAVGGLTLKLNDPPTAMVEMALAMQRAIDLINEQYCTSFKIRIGINCGPVVAGVIGKSKFIYDLWGNTVNLASRMESHGVAGRIQISEAVFEHVKSQVKTEPQGEINIRGKGLMHTYLVVDYDSAAKPPLPL